MPAKVSRTVVGFQRILTDFSCTPRVRNIFLMRIDLTKASESRVGRKFPGRDLRRTEPVTSKTGEKGGGGRKQGGGQGGAVNNGCEKKKKKKNR